jgi:hypothetical protein
MTCWVARATQPRKVIVCAAQERRKPREATLPTFTDGKHAERRCHSFKLRVKKQKCDATQRLS